MNLMQDLTILYMSLGILVFILFLYVLLIAFCNVTQWLMIKRNELRIQRAVSLMRIKTLKTEHEFYKKHL